MFSLSVVVWQNQTTLFSISALHRGMTEYFTSFQVYDVSVLKYSKLFSSKNNISSASRIIKRTDFKKKKNKPPKNPPKILGKPRLCSQSTHYICFVPGSFSIPGIQTSLLYSDWDQGLCLDAGWKRKGLLLKMSQHSFWLRSSQES